MERERGRAAQDINAGQEDTQLCVLGESGCDFIRRLSPFAHNCSLFPCKKARWSGTGWTTCASAGGRLSPSLHPSRLSLSRPSLALHTHRHKKTPFLSETLIPICSVSVSYSLVLVHHLSTHCCSSTPLLLLDFFTPTSLSLLPLFPFLLLST